MLFLAFCIMNKENHKTDRTWFIRLLRHPARKRSGSIPTTPESARGYNHVTLKFELSGKGCQKLVTGMHFLDFTFKVIIDE